MANMLSLLDVLPKHERVDIGGGVEIDIFGISGEDIGNILFRYPDAFQQMANTSKGPAGMDPGLLGALMAACQRNGEDKSLLGNEVVERRSRSLAIGAQMKIMKAMGRCTFPDGVSPFLQDLVSASSAAKEAMEAVVQVVSKVPGMASPPTQKPLEQQDTQPSGS